MKAVRKKNPLIFDLILFLAFGLASFAAYLVTDAAGVAGAVTSIAVLAGICLILIFSR